MELRAVFVQSFGIAALTVRLFTRRRGQKLADVPSHCYLITKRPHGSINRMYEAISTGVHLRAIVEWQPPDGSTMIDVSDIDVDRAIRYADAEVGHHYSWTSIFIRWFGVTINALFDLLRIKAKCRVYSEDRDGVMCSEFVEAVCEHGGMMVTHWLHKSGNNFCYPPSPNDLMFALRLMAQERQKDVPNHGNDSQCNAASPLAS